MLYPDKPEIEARLNRENALCLSVTLSGSLARASLVLLRVEREP